MPQNPLQATVAVNTSGQQAPLSLDSAGAARVTTIPALTVLNLTTAQVVKPGAGRITSASVLVGGTGAGGVYDSLSTASLTAANQLAVLPALTTQQISTFKIDMPFTNGLVIAPGTGQTIAASYE